MKLIFSILGLLCMNFFTIHAQENPDHVEPPFWWTGMKSPVVQLLVHGQGIGTTVARVNYPGVKVLKCEKTSDNYLFIDLEIAKTARAGKFNISFLKNKETTAVYQYELKERKPGSAERKSFTPADVIYLAMPDRFANGDPTNDETANMIEKPERSNLNGRHGGDLKGIRDHLDYLKETGFTALWLTPVLENNMPKYSYHGYAITDYYRVDARFGNNQDYCDMVKEAHDKGLKVIMDMVFNHCGLNYWWMKDLPQPDWIHQWPEFTRSNYRAGVNTDPYRSAYDQKKMTEGWFDVTMPDLNQKNPFLAKYLIQNSIWWIEYAGLDGIRQDTYPYADKEFMTQWVKRLHDEYPDFHVVGEVWMNTPTQVAYWMDGAINKDKFRSYLSHEFDFPLMFAIQQAFNENDGWDKGTARLYELLSYDFVYSDPQRLVIFADNHDIDRTSYILKTPDKVKMALAFLATTRGIPLVYYGTELFMKSNPADGDGSKRQDFPGGWAGDSVNVFLHKNLTRDQEDVYQYTKKLLNWRKTNKAVQSGKLIHFIPENGVYIYFRTLQDQAVMILVNNNEKDVVADAGRCKEIISHYQAGADVMDASVVSNLEKVEVKGKSVRILELKK